MPGQQRRTLECQVLQEVRGTIVALVLCARASVDPGTDGRGLCTGSRLSRNRQAVGERRDLRDGLARSESRERARHGRHAHTGLNRARHKETGRHNSKG